MMSTYLAQLLSEFGRGPLYVLIPTVLFVGTWLNEHRGTGLNEYQLTDQSVISQLRILPSISVSLAWLLGLFWIGGALITVTLKYWFIQPRPWWIDPSLVPLDLHRSSGFGMPSGHSQSAVGVSILGYMMYRWHYSVTQRKLRVVLIFSILFPVLMAWARVSLNAHSILQVTCGLVLGYIWGCLCIRAGKSKISRMVVICLVSFIWLAGIGRFFFPMDATSDNPMVFMNPIWLAQMTRFDVSPQTQISIYSTLLLGGVSMGLCCVPLKYTRLLP